MTAILELDAVSKSYGAIKVVDDLSVSLQGGEALGIVGPNGAGKTTLLNLITGLVPSDRGRVVFEGVDITRDRPHERCRRGIGRTFQIPRPFEDMSVFENVLVGATHGRHKSERASYEGSALALERTGLLPRANALAGSLTLLERKRLELSRALATEPRILLLDEIAGGLTEMEVQELIGTIKDLRAGGMTIIWIEHIVHALLAVVDRLLAMDFGRKVAEGDPETVINSREVQDMYMGAEA